MEYRGIGVETGQLLNLTNMAFPRFSLNQLIFRNLICQTPYLHNKQVKLLLPYVWITTFSVTARSHLIPGDHEIPLFMQIILESKLITPMPGCKVPPWEFH